jgi:Relaxase/Mobilisation nuclease domain/Large polyvalent protein-associated domain 7
MIGKVSFGSGVGGLTRYLTATRERGLVDYVTGDRHEVGATAYRNLAAENAADAAREMDLTSRLSTRCEKPFMHLSLSWHPSERPEEPRMIEAMDRVLAELGLEDRQAVYAVHREKEHQHIHAAVNRVGREGTAWDRWQCKERISAQCRVLEREMGFEPIDKHLRSEHEREQVRTPREQRIYERSGIAPPARTADNRDGLRERIGREARSALRGAESWEQAHERLQAVGVALEAYAHPKTARTGLQLVEITTGERLAASGLGSDYGRRALEKRLGAFEATRSLGVDPRPSQGLESPERPDVAAHRGREASPVAEVQEQRAGGRKATPSESLLDEYLAERAQRQAERANAYAEQRERDQARREELRAEHRVRMERVEGYGFPSGLERAVRSECAFAYAVEREALGGAIACEREALRERHAGQSWTAYVVARAELGEQRAVEQLWRWAGQERRGVDVGAALEQPEGGERTAPTVQTLHDLRARVDTRTGEVAYLWKKDGREAFRDRGDLITVPPGQERDAMRSGLLLAAAKWEGNVRVHGGEAFKRAAVEEAVKTGVHILNPEMQPYQEHCRHEHVRQEQAQERERERTQERSKDRGFGIGR